MKISFAQEFYEDENEHEEVLAGLIRRVRDAAATYVPQKEAWNRG